jgi:hypothetical protein
VDTTQDYPSLINCLETSQNGLFLDLALPSDGPGDGAGIAIGISPFSRTIPAIIKTDGDDYIKRVLLVLQRDHYDTPGSMVPVSNLTLETAWQNAFAFHRNGDPAKAPYFFKHQVSPTGEFRPLQPLFCCKQTRRWFHPVCPQCGLALTLCRDDALLNDRGLPAFSESLERFLYCDSCAIQSDSSAFYRRDKATGMPDIAYDFKILVAQWKQLLAKFPDGADLPCRGCPEKDLCYGPAALGSQRIVPFSFFPFFMLMFPAPSCNAAEFIPIISGAAAPAPSGAQDTADPSGQARFLFQGQDRQFLEILYLKLTFLAQVCHQLLPADDSAANRELAFSLDGIGVDLNPAGAGLPAYWNFNVRILDTIGTAQTRPFTPILPEAPRLHFLGAVWFRALLVNSRQTPDTVYAEVGRLLQQTDIENGFKALQVELSDPMGVFASSQIFWESDQHHLAEHWQGYWKQAMHLGFQLVHAGLKTGVVWDPVQFRSALDALRNQIKDEMFSGPAVALTEKEMTVPSDTIRMVLHDILQKWQAASTPSGRPPVSEAEPETLNIEETVIMASNKHELGKPTDKGLSTAASLKATDISVTPTVDTDWDADDQETVIFSSSAIAPPSESMPRDAPDPQQQDSPWNDDIEETVVISAPSQPPVSPMPDKEADLAATTVQNAPGAPPPPFAGFDEDLEATVVLNSGRSPVSKNEAPPSDDDLSATMVQGAAGPRPADAPRSDDAQTPPLSDRPATGDDPDATVIIRPSGQRSELDHSPGGVDDELEATLIKTPHHGKPSGMDSPPPPAGLAPAASCGPEIRVRG